MRNLVLDLLFPKRCGNCKAFGEFLCGNCMAKVSFNVRFICPLCNKPSITGKTHNTCTKRYGIDGLIPCVVYAGPIKRLAYQFKYQPYVSGLQTFLAQLMQESLEQNELFFNLLQKDPVFIPVPLSSKRLRERGYNHAALLGRHVAQYFNQEYFEKILIRVRDTTPQFNLTRTARFSNVANAFAITPEHVTKIKNQTVILVDDVATTCSTLRECTKVLKQNGAKNVWGLVLARENK